MRNESKPDALPVRIARAAGFTLIELLIAVVIVGILARIAIPAYSQYILRGNLASATNALNAASAQMEQYFQDNRSYTTVGTLNPPCMTSAQIGQFVVSCAAPTSGHAPSGMPAATTTASTYVLVAQGGFDTTGAANSALPTSGFWFTLDNTGTKTSSVPSTFGAGCTSGWMVKPGVCS
jgi:type IV pilus assembly protein PilE